MRQKEIRSKNWLVQGVFDLLSIIRRNTIREGTDTYRFYDLLVREEVAEMLHGNPARAASLLRHRLSVFLNQGFRFEPFTEWILANEPNPRDLELQTAESKQFPLQPRISIVTPVYRPSAAMLNGMLSSVQQQSYPNWEHVVVNADGNDRASEARIRAYARKDPRVIARTLDANYGIAQNTNEAIKLASGEWIAFLDHDDQIAPFALYEVVKLINQYPDVDVIYSDEDKLRASDQNRYSPFFKPDYNLDYLRCLNYMTHFLVVRRSVGEQVGWLDSAYDGSQDYDLALKLTEKTDRIRRIPRLLYHWKAAESSTASSTVNKPYAQDAGERALREHLKRQDLDAYVEADQFPYQARYRIPGQPKISMLIPNRDNCATLQRLIDSIVERSTYPNYEIIIVENGSKQKETFAYYQTLRADPHVKIVDWNQEFNYSLVNNYGEQFASGDVILLLNNDLEVISPDWLERMLEHAMRPEIGAVGAKLLYPNDTIQHGGVIVGLYGCAGHSHKGYQRDSLGYYNRLVCVQNYSAVTAACLMLRRSVFHEVGGLDPAFKLEFGDVDFCLRIRELGYRNLWTPHALLYHHESLTRGGYDTRDKRALNLKEVKLLQTRWHDFLQGCDPSYNPNLTHKREDFFF